MTEATGKDELEQAVLDILSEVLAEPVESFRLQPRLAAHADWDSLRTLEVLAQLEERLAVRLDLREFHRAGTVTDLIELVGRSR